MPVGAIATKCVLGEARTAGDRKRRGMADGGARVPEVLPAAELEGILTASFLYSMNHELIERLSWCI